MSTKIQWRGSNLAEVKAWLGARLGYGDGQVFFDSGRIVRGGFGGEVGFYGDWLVRRDDGTIAVEDGVLGHERTSPHPKPDPRRGENDGE